MGEYWVKSEMKIGVLKYGITIRHDCYQILYHVYVQSNLSHFAIKYNSYP